MARHRRNRNDLPLTADINVTSLVDVAFTLLVVFIIIAPALQGGVEITTPEADVAPLTSVDAPLIVTITREGQVYFEDTPMAMAEFRSAFLGVVEAAPPDVVYVRPDAQATAEQLLQVLGIINAAGVKPSVQAEQIEWTSN
ncbi:ExbD/TolR family protein [Gaopeijia maritima]|uniref:Biopolymer transporter ExbD n=1 Tax=Gaopeijia maritima TaxID=3119007 RepID=A0ABU9E945_9BACT